jgi:hypothetical protein
MVVGIVWMILSGGTATVAVAVAASTGVLLIILGVTTLATVDAVHTGTMCFNNCGIHFGLGHTVFFQPFFAHVFGNKFDPFAGMVV